MSYRLTPLTATEADLVCDWRYGPGQGLASFVPGDRVALLDPALHYHAVYRGEALAGVACFGAAAQVGGGPYVGTALDIGLALAPERVGRGEGPAFVAAVAGFAQQRFRPTALRLTVAVGNHRAIAAFRKQGFVVARRFAGFARGGTHPFLLMTRTG